MIHEEQCWRAASLLVVVVISIYHMSELHFLHVQMGKCYSEYQVSFTSEQRMRQNYYY